MSTETNEDLVERLKTEISLLRDECAKFRVGVLRILHECQKGLVGMESNEEVVRKVHRRAYNTLGEYRSPEATKTPSPSFSKGNAIADPKAVLEVSQTDLGNLPVDNHQTTECYRTYKVMLTNAKNGRTQNLTADTLAELYDMMAYWKVYGYERFGRITLKIEEDKIAGDVDFRP